MNSNFIDNVLPEMSGLFEIKTIDKLTGKIIDEYEEKNVIVIDSKEAIINAISTLTNDGVIEVLKIGGDVGDPVSMQGSPNLNFADLDPDTITRTAGSWIDDGFIDEMTLTITSSVSNNGTFTVDAVTTSTLTLIATDSLVDESGTSGVSVIGTPSLNNPIPPLDTFNSSSMSLIYTSPDTFILGYSNSTSVTFSVTIDGADVMTYYPLDITKTITSAALHTGNTKVFAYKRFPQKSVSALVDILINWTIKFD